MFSREQCSLYKCVLYVCSLENKRGLKWILDSYVENIHREHIYRENTFIERTHSVRDMRQDGEERVSGQKREHIYRQLSRVDIIENI